MFNVIDSRGVAYSLSDTYYNFWENKKIVLYSEIAYNNVIARLITLGFVYRNGTKPPPAFDKIKNETGVFLTLKNYYFSNRYEWDYHNSDLPEIKFSYTVGEIMKTVINKQAKLTSKTGMKEKYIHAYMDMAARFGETSEANKLKVGCLLVKDNAIISEGTNGQPSGWHTEVCEDENGKTLPTVRHAEDAALQKLWNRTETVAGSTVFITHAPCLPCAIKLAEAKVQEVFIGVEYKNTDGTDYLQSRNIPVKIVPKNKTV